MLLSLDISSTNTGWSIFNNEGKLIDYGNIIPDKKLDSLYKLCYVVDEINKLYDQAEELIIEGIFLGRFLGKSAVTCFEYLAKIAGAIEYTWIEKNKTKPYILKAIEARAKMGLNGRCQKAEVQMWVVEKYKFLNSQDISDFNCMIDSLYAEKETNHLTINQFRNRMDKISKAIEEKSNIGNDLADSILLGNAFFKI